MKTLSKQSGFFWHCSDAMKSPVSTNLCSVFTWGFAVSPGTELQNEKEQTWARGEDCVHVYWVKNAAEYQDGKAMRVVSGGRVLEKK